MDPAGVNDAAALAQGAARARGPHQADGAPGEEPRSVEVAGRIRFAGGVGAEDVPTRSALKAAVAATPVASRSVDKRDTEGFCHRGIFATETQRRGRKSVGVAKRRARPNSNRCANDSRANQSLVHWFDPVSAALRLSAIRAFSISV